MAKRGKYKTGSYQAFLYALELHYTTQARQGLAVSKWQPVPRKQPGQFFTLILTCINEPITSKREISQVLLLLAKLDLLQVSRVLQYVLSVHYRKKGQETGLLNLTVNNVLLDCSFGENLELHPQVRKYMLTIRQATDELWRTALDETIKDYSLHKHWPTVSIILGGLPPSFDLLLTLLQKGFSSIEDDLKWQDISVTQFYGFVTGALPKNGQWSDLILLLSKLDSTVVLQLKDLKSHQLEFFSGLDQSSFLLTLLSRSLRRGESWRSLFKDIIALYEEPAEARELKLNEVLKHYDGLMVTSMASLWQMGTQLAWQQVMALDDELLQLIDQGIIDFNAHKAIKSFSPEVLKQLNQLDSEDWPWLLSYVEEINILVEMKQYRAPIFYDLRELYPVTIAYLDELLSRHSKELFMRDFLNVIDYSRDFSAIVKQRFLRSIP